MIISDIKDEPKENTKDDAFKLCMLASQLERLPSGKLDLESALLSWKESVKFLSALGHVKSPEGGIRMAGKITSIRLVPIETALTAMGYSILKDPKTGKLDSQWKDTIRKKLKKADLSKSYINNLIKDWETQGVPVHELNDFKNQRVQFTAEEEERIQELIDSTAESVRVFTHYPSLQPSDNKKT